MMCTTRLKNSANLLERRLHREVIRLRSLGEGEIVGINGQELGVSPRGDCPSGFSLSSTDRMEIQLG